MAYTIPVAALILDKEQAALALGEAPDYFTDPDEDRYEGVERLSRLTGAPVDQFSDEEGEIYFIGVRIKSDWRIDIDDRLLASATALKAKHAHELVQNARLAVVSQFC